MTQLAQWTSDLVALTQKKVKLEQLDPCVLGNANDGDIEIVPNEDLVIDVDSDN